MQTYRETCESLFGKYPENKPDELVAEKYSINHGEYTYFIHRNLTTKHGYGKVEYTWFISLAFERWDRDYHKYLCNEQVGYSHEQYEFGFDSLDEAVECLKTYFLTLDGNDDD